MNELFHEPVLLGEVMRFLAPRAGQVYVDATLGGAGMAEALLSWTDPQGRRVKKVIGIDRDPEAISAAQKRLTRFGDRMRYKHASFEDLPRILIEEKEEKAAGIVMDLGASRHQLTTPERGFSLYRPGPLDMRMDPGEGITAAELLTRISGPELEALLRECGERRYARRIAQAILRAREENRAPTTTRELAALVESVVPAAPGAAGGRIHPATRVFMALRIAVNRELERLKAALRVVPDCLFPGGVVVAIAYHSGEDRIIKEAFHQEARGCICPPRTPVCLCGRKPRLEILTRRPVIPSAEEVKRNPSARSARLRAARRRLMPTENWEERKRKERR